MFPKLDCITKSTNVVEHLMRNSNNRTQYSGLHRFTELLWWQYTYFCQEGVCWRGCTEQGHARGIIGWGSARLQLSSWSPCWPCTSSIWSSSLPKPKSAPEALFTVQLTWTHSIEMQMRLGRGGAGWPRRSPACRHQPGTGPGSSVSFWFTTGKNQQLESRTAYSSLKARV